MILSPTNILDLDTKLLENALKKKFKASEPPKSAKVTPSTPKRRLKESSIAIEKDIKVKEKAKMVARAGTVRKETTSGSAIDALCGLIGSKSNSISVTTSCSSSSPFFPSSKRHPQQSNIPRTLIGTHNEALQPALMHITSSLSSSQPYSTLHSASLHPSPVCDSVAACDSCVCTSAPSSISLTHLIQTMEKESGRDAPSSLRRQASGRSSVAGSRKDILRDDSMMSGHRSGLLASPSSRSVLRPVSRTFPSSTPLSRERGRLDSSESRELTQWIMTRGVDIVKILREERGLQGKGKNSSPEALRLSLFDSPTCESFSSGLLLIALVSKLERKTLTGFHKHPHTRAQCLHNINIALAVLRDKRNMPVDLLWCDDEIYAGHRDIIVNLLAQMRKAYKIVRSDEDYVPRVHL
ncbi:hypothetical protein ADUPG1_011884 [Aduncisulcus paluster]|uniref:Calponin-homology (CH) domain-containing protein n=1 Tax=Aduncisulcus paluster TaxID=2918883 RepID=A0ABQ5K1B2_9EUKA|nr:hypothetical protein ADUPG1_011884 [Aduncisulcus paluster]